MKKTFGIHLRAIRLGFHELHGHYIRVRAIGPPWLIDVCPYHCLPSGSGGEHVVWWEGPDDPFWLREVLQKLVPEPLGEQKTFTVYDDGNEIGA